MAGQVGDHPRITGGRHGAVRGDIGGEDSGRHAVQASRKYGLAARLQAPHVLFYRYRRHRCAHEPELAARSSWGSLFRVDLREENSGKGGSKIKPLDDGMISIFVLGDQLHNSFDNLAFANEHQVIAAEDRGDTLHQQLNVLDSVWASDVDRRQPLASAVRFIALGRDALAAP